MYINIYIYIYMYIYIHIYICICAYSRIIIVCSYLVLRFVIPWNVQVWCAKETCKPRALLQRRRHISGVYAYVDRETFALMHMKCLPIDAYQMHQCSSIHSQTHIHEHTHTQAHTHRHTHTGAHRCATHTHTQMQHTHIHTNATCAGGVRYPRLPVVVCRW